MKIDDLNYQATACGAVIRSTVAVTATAIVRVTVSASRVRLPSNG